MQIYVGNALSTVVCQDRTEVSVSADLLTVYPKRPDYATGAYKPYIGYAVTNGNLTMMSGLLLWFHQELVKRKIHPTYYDQRKLPTANYYPHAQRNFTPYPDQCTIANEMVKQCRGVCNLATNYGKSLLIAEFWLRANRPSLLVIVPTQALLHQTAEYLENLLGLTSDEVGKVGDGHHDIKPVTVGVTGTVVRMIEGGNKDIVQFDALIVDEGHTNTAVSGHKIGVNVDAFWRFWLSGTAYRDEDPQHVFKITELAGPCVAVVSNADLVAAGRSAMPHIRFVDFRFKEENSLYFDDDYHGQYRQLKMDDGRNDLVARVVKLAVDKGFTVLTFTEHKDHMREILSRIGRFTEHVTGGGGSSGYHNDVVRKRMLDGELKSVICTSAWRVGVSIPQVNVLVDASGTKAEYLKLQLFGRLIRMDELGYGFYIDFTDRGIKYPYKHSIARQSMFIKEGFPPKVFDSLEGLFDVEA